MAESNKATKVPGRHPVEAPIAAIANGTSDEILIWRNNTGATVVVKQFGYSPDTAVTGNTTDNFTLQGKVKTAAGGAAANLTSVKTYGTGVDIAQFAEDTLTLSTTVADVEVDDGEAITLDKAETGSGLTLPAGLVSIEFEYKS